MPSLLGIAQISLTAVSQMDWAAGCLGVDEITSLASRRCLSTNGKGDSQMHSKQERRTKQGIRAFPSQKKSTED
ncbi:hypothetical protein CC78DRAFT_344676 [Lojkania enalia]|uniref:Uncharacterized protein n=1 Tax=Lojkania enalia TaxID=147567 RepID=A0A9P4K8X9_9PLEO|nr:hypothetical protein CC78DRAFT_344676 [Didymosphaeria enalia]